MHARSSEKPPSANSGTLRAAGATIDPYYDQARLVWNAAHDRRPALIIRCAWAATSGPVDQGAGRTPLAEDHRGQREAPASVMFWLNEPTNATDRYAPPSAASTPDATTAT